jgi:imidazolonepropionase-like amidohydrolase
MRAWTRSRLVLLLGVAWWPLPTALAQDHPVAPPGETTAIVDVTVVPMTGDRLVRGRTVLLRNGSIAAIVAAGEPLPKGARRIEGRGRYLMPGLADMHVHLQPVDDDGINRKMLGLFLANGVTSVRNMLGSPYLLELRDSIVRGRIRGPTILTSGPVIDGPGSQWGSHAAIVRTAEEAERVVSEQKAAGYDFLKVYSRIGRAAYLALLAAAHRHDMKVAGHVPVSVTIDDALGAGQSSIEHLLGYVDAIESEQSPVRGKQGWHYRMRAFEHVDPARIPVVAAATRAAGVWNCPTLVAMRKWVPPDEARELLQREELKYAPAEVLEHWLPWRGFRLDRFGAEEFALAGRARSVYQALVSGLRQAGAGVLVGTDTPSPMVVPGFSVHEELRYLVEAGFTPQEALAAATRAPAEYWGRSGEFGVVAVGARADLLLLESDPLVDVANVKDLAGVFVRGQWIPRVEIDSLLKDLAAPR